MHRSAVSRVLVLCGLSLLGGNPSAWAGKLSLEGGFLTTAQFPTGDISGKAFVAAGLSAFASYEGEDWSIGIRTHGQLTTRTPFSIQAGTYDLSGDLLRREYGLAPTGRYFFHDSAGRKRAYLELGFLGLESEFLNAEKVYVVPESPDYSRLFLRGSGFSFGAGYRPKTGPWFFQANYELDYYEFLEVVAEVNHLHPILAQPSLNYNYFVHSVVLTIGLDVFPK